MSIIVDRSDGLSAAVAYKGPCRVVTTANITLSGAQTIDSLSIVAGDRLLVNAQTDQTANGIYVASVGAWARAKDFKNNNDIVKGTKVSVTSGTYANREYTVTTANPIAIGTSNIVFALADDVAAAESAKDDAVTAKGEAEDAQGYAEEWAVKAEDSLISVAAGGDNSTDYSALHHAAKAAASASAAQTAEISWVDGGWQTATAYTHTAPRQALKNDGSSYVCILGHTSGASTEPGTGGSWATYWELLAEKGTDGADGDGSGDMLAATYDPNSVEDDAFDMDNMVEGATTKILTDTERTAIGTISAKLTSASTITDAISGVIQTPDDLSYTLVIKAPFAGTITETVTKSTSGTCTATFKINTTALGGTANSVSTSEAAQAHASDNSFVAGDDIVLTVSSNSSCEFLSFTIKFTRALA